MLCPPFAPTALGINSLPSCLYSECANAFSGSARPWASLNFALPLPLCILSRKIYVRQGATKSQPRGECIAPRLPGNRGATLRRSASAPRDRHGPGAARRRTPRSPSQVPRARGVPVSHRAPEPLRHRLSDASVVPRARRSQDSAKARQILLCSGHSARSSRTHRRIRGLIHPAGRGHKSPAPETAHHQAIFARGY